VAVALSTRQDYLIRNHDPRSGQDRLPDGGFSMMDLPAATSLHEEPFGLREEEDRRLSKTDGDESLQPEAIEFLQRCRRVGAGTRGSADITPGTAHIGGRLKHAARPFQNYLSSRHLDGIRALAGGRVVVDESCDLLYCFRQAQSVYISKAWLPADEP
jgi:hypothetical protein